MKNILLAGASGYLGGYIAQALAQQNYSTTVLVRDPQRFSASGIHVDKIIKAQVTKKSTLQDCCKDIDVVISSIGITKQKEGLSYMDVDYQANKNLLEEAKNSGVKKFLYISVLNGEKLTQLSICDAKEQFVHELKKSGLDYCIIRPNGFFSDMSEFYNMANRGRVYLFGDGQLKSNPIHGEDLAEFCVNAINESNNKELEVGGCELLSQNAIANMAFSATGKPLKITYIPDWIRKLLLKTAKLFLNKRQYGSIEFFMTVMAMDMIAPKYGKHTLKAFFDELN